MAVGSGSGKRSFSNTFLGMMLTLALRSQCALSNIRDPMVGVCTRYEEHLSIGSRTTRDVIAKQRRTDLIYQRCVPRSKPFPPAYCHYTRIIGNKSTRT